MRALTINRIRNAGCRAVAVFAAVACACACFAATLALAGCIGGGKGGGNGVDEAAIAQEVAARRAILVGPTWHKADEPTFAYRFLDDGTFEEYYDGSWQGLEYNPDEVQWDLRFSTWEGDTGLSGRSAEDVAKYFDYNLYVTSAQGWDGKVRHYTLTVEFDGDDLILGGDRYVAGPAMVTEIPAGATCPAELVGAVWVSPDSNWYWMLYDDGLALTCKGVAYYGGIAPNDIIDPAYVTWGVADGVLYLMDTYTPSDGSGTYCTVDRYAIDALDAAAGTMTLTDVWTCVTRDFVTPSADDDLSVKILLYNRDKIHGWMQE